MGIVLMIEEIKKDFIKLENPTKAQILSGFFKTGKGQYGEGDVFLGITVPLQRKLACKYLNLKMSDIQKLLNSKIHEYRLTALFILIARYQKSNLETKEKIVNFYLKNLKNINNWDLVDLSAPKILGHYLQDKDKSLLYELAKSNNLWKRRISMLTTYTFIKNKQFDDTLKIAELLLNDKQDLIHKAVGWMLREIGKIDQKTEEMFLKKYYKIMPRTMLRYAIEKFPEEKRKYYLKK